MLMSSCSCLAVLQISCFFLFYSASLLPKCIAACSWGCCTMILSHISSSSHDSKLNICVDHLDGTFFRNNIILVECLSWVDGMRILCLFGSRDFIIVAAGIQVFVSGLYVWVCAWYTYVMIVLAVRKLLLPPWNRQRWHFSSNTLHTRTKEWQRLCMRSTYTCMNEWKW